MKLFYVLVFIISLEVTSQTDLFYKGSQISYTKVDNEFIAISQRPVTNREYIIYLMWLRDAFVHEPKYCNLFYYSVPGLNVDSIRDCIDTKYKGYFFRSVDMNTVIDYSKAFVRDYMFNPKYLDYPVVGVSWQNANNYGKWLSDRFNEVTMIKKNLIDHDGYVSYCDYFDTGFYIAGLWQGQLKIKLPAYDEPSDFKDFEWHDHIFVPAFRLPSKNEVIHSTETKTVSEFKPYPFSKKHFLYEWNKRYFHALNDTSYILTNYYNHDGYSRDTISLCKIGTVKIADELYLDINESVNRNILNIYFQNGHDQHSLEYYKDNWYNAPYQCEPKALNPCVIIDEDKNHNPIFVTEYENIQPPDYVNFKCFRLACSMGKKQYAKIIEK